MAAQSISWREPRWSHVQAIRAHSGWILDWRFWLRAYFIGSVVAAPIIWAVWAASPRYARAGIVAVLWVFCAFATLPLSVALQMIVPPRWEIGPAGVRRGEGRIEPRDLLELRVEAYGRPVLVLHARGRCEGQQVSHRVGLPDGIDLELLDAVCRALMDQCAEASA